MLPNGEDQLLQEGHEISVWMDVAQGSAGRGPVRPITALGEGDQGLGRMGCRNIRVLVGGRALCQACCIPINVFLGAMNHTSLPLWANPVPRRCVTGRGRGSPALPCLCILRSFIPSFSSTPPPFSMQQAVGPEATPLASHAAQA